MPVIFPDIAQALSVLVQAISSTIDQIADLISARKAESLKNMPKRAAENEEWEHHKEEIISSYQSLNAPLQQVQEYMANKFEFRRTKAQYERKLKTWGIKKNSKAEEWKFISRRFRERETRRLPTSVEIRGEQIPSVRLKREIARYGYQTTMERLNSTLTHRPRSETPPGIRIFTPLCSPSPSFTRLTGSVECSSVISRRLSTDWTDEAFLCLADCTPWRSFMGFVSSLDGVGPLILQSKADCLNPGRVHSPTPYPVDTNETTEIVQGIGDSQLGKWLNGMLFTLYTPEFAELCISMACIKPNQFLPPTRQSISDIDVNAVIKFSDRSTQMEFLKHAIHLISNNFDTGEAVGRVVAELAREKHNLSLLQSLYDQRLFTTDAFFENLFVPALLECNLPLLEKLLKAGCDINADRYVRKHHLVSRDRTPLQYAIETGEVELVSFLLAHGANGANRNVFVMHDSYFREKRDSFLDCAVEKGHFCMVKELLTPRSQFHYGCPEVTIYTLRFSVQCGDIEILRFLLDHRPSLYEEMKLEPWILLEPAARHSTEIFSALIDYGLDVNKIDETGKGSVLAAAAESNNLALVQHLIAIGADICGVSFHPSRRLHSRVTNAPAIYGDYDTMAALHLAIINENEEIVAYLIQQGADVNQCCQDVFPLQLAVFSGNQILVSMLLSADADVNAVAGGVVDSRVNPFLRSNSDLRYHSVLQEVAGRPATRLALEIGHASIFDDLLRHSAVIPNFSTGATGWDPLRSAASSGNRSLTIRIFKGFKTMDLNIHEYLSELIFLHGLDLVDEFITLGIMERRDIYCTEVLCAATYRREVEFVQKFLMNAKGKCIPGCGSAAFALAASNGYVDMHEIFLNGGLRPYEAIPSLPDSVKERIERVPSQCALVEAINYYDGPRNYCPSTTGELRLLLDKCEKPDIDSGKQDMWRRAMFEAGVAAIECKKTEHFSALVSRGLEIDWKPFEEVTLLQYSATFGTDDITRNLLELKADPNGPAISHSPISKSTALQAASSQGKLDIVELLLHHGADVHAKPGLTHGATALQFAAISGSFEVVNRLLKAGADVNEPPGKHDGRTAIEAAAEHGRLDMVRYLLEAGARVEGRTNVNYRRTIYRAWRHGYRPLVRMIQSWKSERYGVEDCEDVGIIMETMTHDELEFESPAAKSEFEDWVVSNAPEDERKWYLRERGPLKRKGKHVLVSAMGT